MRVVVLFVTVIGQSLDDIGQVSPLYAVTFFKSKMFSKENVMP